MIKSKEQQTHLEIDLTGPDGNAFNLLSVAKKLSLHFGYNPDEVQFEMMCGDYEHLIEVFENYFGDYVILYR